MDDDGSKVLTFPTGKVEPNRATAWPDEARMLAFELWYTDAGRKLRTLESLLASEPYSLPIPYKTLWEWHHVGQWDIEADRKMQEFVPHRRMRTFGHLVVAAEGMASYLARVASGATTPTKEMNAAAKIAMDAAGFASVRVEAPAPAIEAGETDGPLDLSPAAAAERIRQRREGWKG